MDAAQIGVTVTQGIVTLTGHVPTHAEKIAAEEAARRVGGVRGVADELEVRSPAELAGSDEALAIAAADALAASELVPAGAVQAVVENGRITLVGDVTWQFQKEACAAAVGRLVGMKSVVNAITLRSPEQPEPPSLGRRIQDALGRIAALATRPIGVDERGGRIKLHGAVRSWSEVEAARHAAWSAPGVVDVDCHDLQIEPPPRQQ